MKIRFLFIVLLSLTMLSCHDDFDDVVKPSETIDIQDFVWRAMNDMYLYKADSPDLANDRFSTQDEFKDYLSSYNSPENLFEDLLATQDRFSIIVSDYTALENSLSGVNQTTGARVSYIQKSGSNQVYGFIRYVLPSSSADEKGLERGMIFNKINDEALTIDSNFFELTYGNSYTIQLAQFVDDELVSIDQSVTLEKRVIQENPVHYSEVLNFDTAKIGYLVYNNFRGDFDSELNAVFQNFNTHNIDELIIDLRYNSGGSVESCKDLASMITGQFTNQVFARQLYNSNFDSNELFFDTNIRSGESINSLGLSKVYILTSHRSASASELLINSLSAYIDVVQIGETTVGKFEASRTLYDSPNYSKSNINIGHTYALQPLISKLENANGKGDYAEGLVPQFQITEDFQNAKAFGDTSESLLSKALNIIGLAKGKSSHFDKNEVEIIFEDYQNKPNYQKMYLD